MLVDSFDRPDGLVTNEFAHYNPDRSTARRSPTWDLTSGSLFIMNGVGWTGVPDSRYNPTDPSSRSWNHSTIFRMTSRRSDFRDIDVHFSLRNDGLVSTRETPPMAYDGVHVFLRYVNETSLYYATVNRRDGSVLVKKKVPGGPSNGGTYYLIGSKAAYRVSFGRWQDVRATVSDETDGAVRIELSIDGHRVVSALDTGIGGPPIHGPGKIGLRGDNTDFRIDNLIVRALAVGPKATSVN